jgi:deazaflavin-dependent oxidoreductase (nitroreductase family)
MIMPVMDASGVSRDARWAGSAGDAYCYLTTSGRRTGQPHTIEIWFGLEDDHLFMLSGGGARSDWVRNAVAHPDVTVRLGDRTFPGRARVVEDRIEDQRVRRRLASKYQGWAEGRPMSRWARTALPIAVDLAPPSGSGP